MTFDQDGRSPARQLSFGLAIGCAFVFGLFLALMSSALWDNPSDQDTRTVFGMAAALFTVTLIFVGAGLITRPAWVSWVVAALLCACPILLFSGALTWLINTI